MAAAQVGHGAHRAAPFLTVRGRSDAYAVPATRSHPAPGRSWFALLLTQDRYQRPAARNALHRPFGMNQTSDRRLSDTSRPLNGRHGNAVAHRPTDPLTCVARWKSRTRRDGRTSRTSGRISPGGARA